MKELAMAEITPMTVEKAEQIISSKLYGDYSEDELRAVIECLQSDPTRANILDKFYNDANIIALSVNNEENLASWTFWELTQSKKLFDVVENDENIKSAAEKLDAAIVEKFSSLKFLYADEIEDAEYLAGKITDADARQKAQNLINQEVARYEDMNGLNQDAEVLSKNDQTLSHALDEFNLYAPDGKISEDFQELAALIEKIEIVPLAENEDKDPEQVKRSNIEMMFEAAKLQTHTSLVGDIRHLLTPKQKQKEQIVERIQDKFREQVLLTSVASELGNEDFGKIDTPEKLQKYAEKKEELVEKALDDIDGASILKLNENDVVTACADTEQETTQIAKLLERKMTKASQLRGQIEKFNQKATSLWGKTYTIRKNIVANLKDNKWMHIANTAGTAAVAVAGMTASAPAVGAAIGAYAVYSAAGAWVWPVVAEARKMQREAVAKGEEKPAFGKVWKEAWSKLKNDKNYKNRAKIGTVAGIIGGMVGFGGTSIGVNTVAQRGIAALSRMAGSLSAQTMAYVNARQDYKKDANEENKAKLKAAGVSLGIGAVISGLSAWFSVDRMASVNSPVLDNVAPTPAPQTPIMPADSIHVTAPADSLDIAVPADSLNVAVPADSLNIAAPADTLNAGVSVGDPAAEMPAEPEYHYEFVDFPSEYNAEMGITEGQFNNLRKLYSESDLTRMYSNLNQPGVMDNFDGMTKEQVLFKWSKLDAYTDRVRWDESAQQYVSIQGAKRYHFEDEMTWLNKLINCDDTVLTAEQYAKINDALATIDDRGGYHGPGYVPTNNYHVAGAGVEDCGEGQENHFNRGGVIKEPEPEPQSEPRVEPQPEPQPEPVVTKTAEPEPVTTPEPVELTSTVAQVSYAKEFDPHIWNDAKYDAAPRGFGTDSQNFKDLNLVGKDGKEVTLVYQGTDKETGDMAFKVKGGKAEWTLQPVPGVEAKENGRYILIENYRPEGQEAALAAANAAGVTELNHLSLGNDGNYHMFTEHGQVSISPDGQNVAFETANERGVPADIQNQVVSDAVQQFNNTDGNGVRIESLSQTCADAGTPVEVKGSKAKKLGLAQMVLNKLGRGSK